MGVKIIRENYRVEVEPDEPYLDCDKTHERRRASCEDLRKEIRRHVDGILSASVNWDTKRVCEFCGRPWTEGDDDPHNGGGCDQDAANMPPETTLCDECDGRGWYETECEKCAGTGVVQVS